MTLQKLTEEQIYDNWNAFRAFFSEDTLGARSEAANKMLDALEDKMILCPASARTSYHCAYPGGLVEHTLRVIKNSMKLVKAFDLGDKISVGSIAVGAGFHDLGKVGFAGEDEDYYVVQTDSWRRDKLGEVYTHSDKIPYMTVPQRGLFLCQQFGFKLTFDETMAILLNDGFIVEENKKYCLKEPPLATIVMTADYLSTCQEKGNL